MAWLLVALTTSGWGFSWAVDLSVVYFVEPTLGWLLLGSIGGLFTALGCGWRLDSAQFADKAFETLVASYETVTDRPGHADGPNVTPRESLNSIASR